MSDFRAGSRLDAGCRTGLGDVDTSIRPVQQAENFQVIASACVAQPGRMRAVQKIGH
jgi:hypothetical protein